MVVDSVSVALLQQLQLQLQTPIRLNLRLS
uniref:Uncharacterized protein n=1 Tax=Arundo donax TaxID=35708 RepID=A0A0A9GYJ5_ARUDO